MRGLCPVGSALPEEAQIEKVFLARLHRECVDWTRDFLSFLRRQIQIGYRPTLKHFAVGFQSPVSADRVLQIQKIIVISNFDFAGLKIERHTPDRSEERR